MVDSLKIEGINGIYEPNFKSKYGSEALKEAQEESIFRKEKASELRAQLEAVEDNNGVIRNGWDDVKAAVGIGTSVSKCDEAINDYKNGKISFEEASGKIEEYAEKQDSGLNLFANIITAISSIGAVAIAAAATVVSGGTLAPLAAIAIGAATGAVTKTGFKLLDRATNNVQGDDFDGNQLAKDALSGAVTGGVAAATMGTAGSATSVGKAAVGCAKTGVKTGAIVGSSNYTIDCAFDEDKDFSLEGLAGATTSGAVTGGTVGLFMGGLNGMLHSTGALKSGCNLKAMTDGGATARDIAANAACTTEYKIVNKTLRDIAA